MFFRDIPVRRVLITVAVAAVLLGAAVFVPSAAAEAKTTWQLNEELSQARERLDQAKQKVAQAQAVELAAQWDIAGLDQKIELLEERAADATKTRDAAAAKLAVTRKALDKVSAELSKKRTQFDKAESDLAHANAALEARAVGIYKAGRVGYVMVVLQQGDLKDLLNRMDLFSRVMDLDIKMAEEIRVLQGQVLEEGRALEAKQTEASAVEQVQAKETGALDGIVVTRAAALKEVTDARAAKRALAAKAETDMETWQEKTRQLQDESAEIQAALRGGGSKGSVQGTGRMIWPVEGVITSPFGDRESPIFNKMEMHTGIDIGADSGTPIYAADSGTVVLAEVKGGYGKCIIISHGNGLTTLYGHQSKLSRERGAGRAAGPDHRSHREHRLGYRTPPPLRGAVGWRSGGSHEVSVNYSVSSRAWAAASAVPARA